MVRQYHRYYKKNTAPRSEPVRVNRNWSEYQKDIFQEIENGSGNLHIDALAGTGKTTTLLECFYHIPSGASALMVAFNKSIATELKNRAPLNVDVSTLHSLGLKAITRAFGRVKVETDKLRGYIKAELGDEKETLELRQNIEKAVNLAKGYLAESADFVVEVCNKHDVDFSDKSEDEFATLVLKLMDVTKNDTNRVDFSDMIWFPYVHNLSPVRYDFVFIDEAQDLNLAQIDLALRSVKRNGRVVSCGDSNQAIYSFRGASTDAIDNIVSRMNSKRLPLSRTYRCGKMIVQEAQQFVENYEAAETNSEGKVETVSQEFMCNNAKPGDFILSRTNAPLISLCLGFLKEGKKANILGKDLGKNLISLIKRSNKKSIGDFLDWVQEYRDREVEKYTRMRREKAAENISDKIACLIVLCDGAATMQDVKDNIGKLFHDGDDNNRIMLSTTHKSKGSEKNRVWMLNWTFRPSKGGEEANITYVAITRAISELYYVHQ
jgi:superfamily I DNA/RNA helicase